ncbi:MAG: GGDEF domain-containing protein [Chloroflexota bacterium]
MTGLWRQVLVEHRSVLAAHAVAGSRRFRARARPGLVLAIRWAMGLIVVVSIIDCIWLLPGHPDALMAIGATNLATGVVAAIVAVALRYRRHVPAEPLVFGVLCMVDLAIIASGRVDLEIARLGAGYQLLLPLLVMSLIPWGTRYHVRWLAVHAVIAAAGSAFAPPELLLEGGPRILIGLLFISTALSLFGHLSIVHGRVEAFLRLGQIQQLRRLAERDHARASRLNLLLEKAARVDQLTGLGNRAALHEQLRTIRRRIRRSKDTYALLMLDLDHFKGINDHLGHFAGDGVLRRVARAMAAGTRATDAVFRMGGEEFIALLPIASPADLLPAADRVRRAIERLGIAHPDNPPYDVVTTSVGAYAIGPSTLDHSDEDWLHMADLALYEAKATGRNRSVARRDSRPVSRPAARPRSLAAKPVPVRLPPSVLAEVS